MFRRMTIQVAAAATAAALLLVTGCTTNTGPGATLAQQKQTLDDGVASTMATLYSSVPGATQLGQKAVGVLVFPKVYEAGLVVGGQHGQGALEVGGRTVGYFQLTGLSLGLEAGAESRGLVFMFMTQHALDRFLTGNGWTAGVDATVAMLRTGANGMLDTTSAKEDVAAFALTNSGLMAGASVDGTKVARLDLPSGVR